MKIQTAQHQFKYILVLRNDKSTHVRSADKYLTGLVSAHPCVTPEVAAVGSSASVTHKRLRAHKELLGPQTLFCIAGGDGTVNRAVEFLLGDDALSAAARRTPVLPLWAGNANDLAHMLNGFAPLTGVAALLRKAQIVPIYPLVCTLVGKDGRQRTHHATCYASFGVTGAVAHRINRHEHRKGWWRRIPGSRFVGEAVATGRTFLSSSGFTMVEDGVEHELHERTYVNGTRMGKLQPLASSLAKKQFLQISISKHDRHVFAAWRWLLRSMRPAPQQQISRESTFTTTGSIWMQIDGEPMKVAAGTRISVRASPVPLYVVSTKLPGEA